MWIHWNVINFARKKRSVGNTQLLLRAKILLFLISFFSYGPGGVGGEGGHLGIFLGGFVQLGTPNWHPVLKKIPLKLIPRSRNGPIFYTPF